MDSWEYYKDVLRTLYSSKDRKVRTLRSIMAHMEAKYNFVRNKGQYERQFRSWGFRKNSTSENWKVIHGKIQKRLNEGKESAVYRSGKRVQVEKLNKEKRHNFRNVEELFSSCQPTRTACCVEKYCRHATEELPQTPEGFVVCTPMGGIVPPLFINNLPSLRLFSQLRSLVPTRMSNSQHSPSRSINHLTGTNEAACVRMESHSVFDKQVATSVNDAVTASAAIPAEDCCDIDSNLDLTSFKDRELDRRSLRDLFQVSRTGELSSSILPMLHRASNNLLSRRESHALVDLIVQCSDRRVFNALISTRLPATQAIARSLLPAAIKSLDVELVRSLLDTGVSPDAPIDYTLRTPLQFAIADGNLDEGILDMVQLLLDKGARVDPAGVKHMPSPLLYAAAKAHLGLVELLLAAGADVNAHTGVGESTALQVAVGAHVYFGAMQATSEHDRFRIAQLLLDAGADVNTRPGYPWRSETVLQAAVKHNDAALVQMLLSHGANVNAPPPGDNKTALQRAASAENLEIIHLLVEYGALIDFTAIECALEQGHIQAAQALWSSGARFDDANHQAYNRMLSRAVVRSGNGHLVSGFLDTKIDVDARMGACDTKWTTLLQEAAMKGDTDLVRLLISFGADVNAPANDDHGRTVLQSAARAGNAELVRILLHEGADPNATSSTMALELAAESGSLEIVQLLLDYGADTFVQGAAATMAATMADAGSASSAEIVQLLLNCIAKTGVNNSVTKVEYYMEYRYHIDCKLMLLLLKHGILDNNCALRYAISRSESDLVMLALEFGAEVNNGLLEFAMGMGEYEIMQILLKHCSIPEEKVRTLRSAASVGSPEAVELLLRAGTDVNAAHLNYTIFGLTQPRRTALQAAAQQGHLDVVRLLLEGGAEVERSSISVDEEVTALQLAAMSGSIATANELIRRGANVNAAPMGKNGRTALEGAAEHGRVDMVQLLLNLETEVRGSRALQFARKEGHDGVATLLLQNGFEDDVRMSG